MASNRVAYEQRSVLLALEPYLTSGGWSGITYTDGYQSDNTITNPQVSVTFLPSSPRELQMGRVTGEDRLFNRRVQVNAYMESEKRAQAVVDDIMDFMDLITVNIVDPSGNTNGYMLVPHSENIFGDVLPPLLNTPKLLRWRGVARGEYESFYPNG